MIREDRAGKERMDIYSIHQALLVKLADEHLLLRTTSRFDSCRTNTDRVKLIEKFLMKFKIIPRLVPRRAKNNIQSRELRKKGNALFKKENLYEALELYNQSLCWAETGDEAEDLANAYANRAAVFCKWNMFKIALENVVLAKKYGYPEKNMDKLLDRERCCLQSINNGNDVRSTHNHFNLKLDYEENPQIPFIAKCLEMKESNDQGRYITTNTILNPGDIIAIEEPYAVCLQPPSRYQRCNYCLIENDLHLIPCPSCTNAMFCSKKCMKKANAEYHNIECAISDIMLDVFHKMQVIGLRVSLKAMNTFQSTDDMIAFCTEANDANFTTFSFNHANELTPLEQCQQIYCLATNEEKRKPHDLFLRAVVTTVLWKQLMEHTTLADALPDTKSQSTFIEILFRHMQIASTNFHTLDVAELPLSASVDYGSGAYPFCSLLNHSCAPNICRMSVGRKMILFALRVIHPGEQLFDNYGYHHCLAEKADRQNSLADQYLFSCNCIACEFDYPMLPELPVSPEIPHHDTTEDVERLTNLDETFATENIKRYAQYLKKYDSHYPCNQVCEMQEIFKMCFHILVGNYSLQVKCGK
ncbi:SET and MYND domain-containing protein 4 [Pseudolycoriella hygida]|uniref:Protein-lysine N-methyltransferase SMYD4 n=1 Tax=Pseudolycoriella hygida TaxID=35572 RepID=A0A9Q0MLC6_9DIPT|nr:SET and MYND domain-containing protein 4 [Pseudolycoriella hygida]